MDIIATSTWSLNHVVPVVGEATDGYIHNQNHIRPWLSDQVFVAVVPMVSVWYFDQYHVSYGS